MSQLTREEVDSKFEANESKIVSALTDLRLDMALHRMDVDTIVSDFRKELQDDLKYNLTWPMFIGGIVAVIGLYLGLVAYGGDMFGIGLSVSDRIDKAIEETWIEDPMVEE